MNPSLKDILMISECASIGGTIINSLQDKWNFKQIIHKKNILDKSFGMVSDIIRSKADIYHSHFLLQHTFLPLIFNKRPLVGHGHGTDIRDDLDKFLRKNKKSFKGQKCPFKACIGYFLFCSVWLFFNVPMIQVTLFLGMRSSVKRSFVGVGFVQK